MGVGLGALLALADDVDGEHLTGSTVLYPCITTWPMGFAWSSAIAQDVSLHALVHTGFPVENIISDLHVFPLDHSELALICTDDTILIHHSKPQALQRLKALEESFVEHGIPRRADKDETAQDELIGIGCHLVNSPARVQPALTKLVALLKAIFELVMVRRASPHCIAAIIGVAQWFALMALSFFRDF